MKRAKKNVRTKTLNNEYTKKDNIYKKQKLEAKFLQTFPLDMDCKKKYGKKENRLKEIAYFQAFVNITELQHTEGGRLIVRALISSHKKHCSV